MEMRFILLGSDDLRFDHRLGRHREERQRQSNPFFPHGEVDCFRLRSLSYGGQVAELVIGPRFARTRWLAMTIQPHLIRLSASLSRTRDIGAQERSIPADQKGVCGDGSSSMDSLFCALPQD